MPTCLTAQLGEVRLGVLPVPGVPRSRWSFWQRPTVQRIRQWYRQRFPGLGVEDLLAKHETRLGELEATHGPPLETVATAAGLAEAVESALVTQLGG